ncbi:MAG: hydantoinase B/oxoprolinase family protein, partial [Bauldia litoralis]
ESFFDNDMVVKDERIRIHAKVTVDGGHMTIDLSGCSGERRAAINARTFAAAFVAYKGLTAPLEAVNEGSFRALDVVIPEGNIMMARFPAPMSAWSIIIPTVVDTIFKALAPALPNVIPAAHHGLLGGAVVFFGRDPKTSRSFVVQSIEGGGWGGRPIEDGESGTVSVCQGDVRNATIEGIELKCPVVVEQRALRQDSGGAGKYRGGLGLDTIVRNLVEGRWNMPSSLREISPPWGLWGGRNGEIGGFLLKEPGDDDFRVMDAHHYLVPVDSQVITRTGGGGGFGDPLERDPDAVMDDVTEGFISRAAAERDYGVVLTEDGSAVDHEATKVLRDQSRNRTPSDVAAGSAAIA